MQILAFFCEVLSHILSFMDGYVGLVNLVPISSH